MDFLGRMTRVVDYIEEHIAGDIDLSEMARIVCCGAYQFGRIFSYVVGVPLSEYIRRRRLSLAAAELRGGGAKVIDVALKYGYDSPDAFTRAFSALHGVTPKEAITGGVTLRLYPRITFYISIRGDVDMEYRIVTMDAVQCVGMVKNLGVWTPDKELEHWHDRGGELARTWDVFLDEGMNIIIRNKYKLYREPFWQVGLTHTTEQGETIVCIGAQAREGEEYPELMPFEIPAATWAAFRATGTLNQSVHPVEALMARIVSEWLPSSGYQRSMNYDIEIYGPGNTQKDDYVTEVWMPVVKL